MKKLAATWDCVQQGNSKLSYANTSKLSNDHKPSTNNTTDQTSETPTLHQQLKLLAQNPPEGLTND